MALRGGSLDGTDLNDALWPTGFRVTHVRLEGHPGGDQSLVVLHVSVATPGAEPDALPRIVTLAFDKEAWPAFREAIERDGA